MYVRERERTANNYGLGKNPVLAAGNIYQKDFYTHPFNIPLIEMELKMTLLITWILANSTKTRINYYSTNLQSIWP